MPGAEPTRTARLLAAAPPPAGRAAALARLWAVPRVALETYAAAAAPAPDADPDWAALYANTIAPVLPPDAPPLPRGFHSPDARLFRLLVASEACSRSSALLDASGGCGGGGGDGDVSFGVSRAVVEDVVVRVLARRRSPLLEKNMPIAVASVLFCIEPEKRAGRFSVAVLRRAGLAGALRRFELQNDLTGPLAALDPTRFVPLLRDLADAIDDSEQREGAGYGVSGCSLAGGGGGVCGGFGVGGDAVDALRVPRSPHHPHPGCLGAVVSKGAVMRYAERRDLLTRRAVHAVFSRHGSLVCPRPKGSKCDYAALAAAKAKAKAEAEQAAAAAAAKAAAAAAIAAAAVNSSVGGPGNGTSGAAVEVTCGRPGAADRGTGSQPCPRHVSGWSNVTDSSSSGDDSELDSRGDSEEDDDDSASECCAHFECHTGSTASSVVSIPSPQILAANIGHSGATLGASSSHADLEGLDVEMSSADDGDDCDESDDDGELLTRVGKTSRKEEESTSQQSIVSSWTRTVVEEQGMVEVLSGLDFVRLYLALVKCGTDVGVRYWFSVLDVDGDGLVSERDAHHFYGERRRDGERRQAGTVLCGLASVWTRVCGSAASPLGELSLLDVLGMSKADREFLLCALLIRRIDDVQLVDVAATDRARQRSSAADGGAAAFRAAANASRPPLPQSQPAASTTAAV